MLIFASGISVWRISGARKSIVSNADSSVVRLPTVRELNCGVSRESKGQFQQPPLKYLCNVNVLTRVRLLCRLHRAVETRCRPVCTEWSVAGSGCIRQANCTVLDYGGNVLGGPVDQRV